MTYQFEKLNWIRLLIAALISIMIYPTGVLAAEEFVLADGVTRTTTEPVLTPEANIGTYEGGPTGTHQDAFINLQVPEEVQRSGGGGYNIPTGAPASPLFGAQSYTQKLLRFEEFGTVPMRGRNQVIPGMSFPEPPDYKSSPDSPALDAFLTANFDNLYPYPERMSNQGDGNPWKQKVGEFLGRPNGTLENSWAEGRPPGEWWSHQRHDEFYPQRYFITAMAGARHNGGARDGLQRHGYAVGEFGPKVLNPETGLYEGGLYHNTAAGAEQPAGSGLEQFNGSTAGIGIKFHPNMPLQDPRALWTFDGTLPPKLLVARYGDPLLLRHYNALPIDPSENMGFGMHTITTHEHNGHNPAESDGFLNAFFFPGQYYDYNWPMQLAGHDSINTRARDRRAGTPDGNGGITKIPGDFRETMSTHWFHDHMLDFTAQNVYKGNAAMMNYYSAIDRGNEGISDGVNLRFPSGTALDWGNRDYDVQLLIAGKAWDQNGQLFFNVFNTDGFLGDVVLTNWLYHPTMDVRARRYRFRIINGSVSRYMKFALVTETGERVPMHMIANDGNIMEYAIPFDGELPTQAIAERYDIIVDFSKYPVGTKLYMVNLMEHKNGKGPETDPIPLADVLSGAYEAVLGSDGFWKSGDPTVGKFLEFVVQEYNGRDLSMDPTGYEPGKRKMLPLPRITDQELANAIHRDFHFGLSNGTDEKPWTIKTDGGTGYNADPRRISAAPNLGNSGVEIWHLSTGGGWAHPVHIHFEEGQILTRDGDPPPIWEQYARKDIYRIGPETDSTKKMSIAIRFREFAGTYVEHCHNTQHEDTAMLMRWDSEHPGQTILLPTPMPTWEGVHYVDSHGLSTFRTGNDGPPPAIDTTAPVITILGDNPVTVNMGTTYVDQGASVADDLDPAPIMSVTSNVDTAQPGNYTVTYNATDASGNTAVPVSRTVTVIDPGGTADTTAPVINVTDVTVEATGPSTVVTLSATATDDVDGSVIPEHDQLTPAGFPVGTTQVTWTAADAAGNSSTATQMVTVVDTTPPVITVSDVTVDATGPVSVILTATATDAVDGSVTPVLDPLAPSSFPLGSTTQVTWTATDAAGNSSIATQTVTVNDVTPAPTPTVENCSLRSALYIGGRGRDIWSITGSSDILQNQNVDVYLGSIKIGSTTVSPTGRISLRTRNAGIVPNPGDQVRIETSLGCAATKNARLFIR